MFQYNNPVLKSVNSHEKNLDQPRMNPALHMDYYIEESNEITFFSDLGY